MLFIDQLAYRSKLRFESPMLKTFFAISLLLMVVSFRSLYFGLSIILFMGIITVIFGGIPLNKYTKLLKIPFLFILLSVIAIVVNITSRQMPGICLKIGGIYIGLSQKGISEAIAISVTAFGAVSCLYFLALNTPMTDILYVLGRIRCPDIIVELMLLIYRFIFVLLDIAQALTTAQKSRLGNRNMKTSIRSVGSLMAVLLFRSFQKSSFLYESMESRCYNGNIKVLYECKQSSKTQMTVVGICVLAFFVWGILSCGV